LLASGCAAGQSGEFGSERKVVAEFFDLLESGKTVGISALLSDDSPLTPDVLDSGFYADAVATPTDHTVTSAYESEPGIVYISVEYKLGGKDRDIKVEVVDSDEGPRIAGWIHDTVTVFPLRAPGAWEVNGTVSVGQPEEATQWAGLPGIYTFEYVDPAGAGTVDPDGEATSSFEVEFPVDGDQLVAAVPAGVEALGSSLRAQSRLLASVADDVERQFAARVADCTRQALVGDSCPAELVSQVTRRGPVDTSRVDWRQDSTDRTLSAEQWDVVERYSVTFEYQDDDGETARDTVDATLTGVVESGSQGAAAIRFS
jgi:hypothetical protein